MNLGVGQGFASLNCILLIQKHFKRRLGLAQSIWVCGMGIGDLVMPQVGESKNCKQMLEWELYPSSKALGCQ